MLGGPPDYSLYYSHAIALGAGLALGMSAFYVVNRRSQVTASYVGVQLSKAAQLSPSVAKFEDDDILREQLTRNVQFFGLEGQKQVSRAFVVVIGLGGVGSHAAHLLLRSGIGRLRLVDFDMVSLSSLNRHAVATRDDVGAPKATVLLSHFKKIVPEADIEACNEMFTAETEDALLCGTPDFVIDAIDNIATKVALLAACHHRKIPVLCVAGAGAKADPTRLKILDVSESVIDPLARSVRHRLRRDYDITSNIPVLLSTEKPRCGLTFCGQQGTDPLDYQIVPGFRVRTIPVLGTTPAFFGMAAAAYVICHLAKAPFYPEPVYRIQAMSIKTQFHRLEDREVGNYGNSDGLQVDEAEVEVILRELWRGRSAREHGPPMHDRSLTRNIGHLALTRWDRAKPATIDNLILLTQEEADEHDRLGGVNEALRNTEWDFCSRVESVLERAKEEFKYSYFGTCTPTKGM